MAWPTTAVATGDLITAAQLNLLPIRLADSTLGSPAASVDLTSIPSVYAHLLLVIHSRGTTAATTENVRITFNNDTANNYDWERLQGNAATASAVETFATGNIMVMFHPCANATASVFAGAFVFIPNYANASFNKSCVSIASTKSGTTTGLLWATIFSGHWRSTAAINRITVTPATGNMDTGSRVSLYGIA